MVTSHRQRARKEGAPVRNPAGGCLPAVARQRCRYAATGSRSLGAAGALFCVLESALQLCHLRLCHRSMLGGKGTVLLCLADCFIPLGHPAGGRARRVPLNICIYLTVLNIARILRE